MILINKLLNRISILIVNAYGKSRQIEVSDLKQIDQSSIIEHAYVYGDVKIGKNVKITKGVHISGNISIGDFTAISGPNTDLYSHLSKIVIGKFCSIARNVSFQEYFHYSDRLSTAMINSDLFGKESKTDIYSKGDIYIGHDVWIGTHSVILSGVRIGNGAIIGANSVVTEDIPDYAIAAGSPARIIKYRFEEETITLLNTIGWWDWSIEKLEENQHLFQNRLTPLELNELRNLA